MQLSEHDSFSKCSRDDSEVSRPWPSTFAIDCYPIEPIPENHEELLHTLLELFASRILNSNVTHPEGPGTRDLGIWDLGSAGIGDLGSIMRHETLPEEFASHSNEILSMSQ